MGALYVSHYDGTDQSRFERDLFEKNEVLVLRASGRLIGFTTLALSETSWRESAVRIVFSGDTVIDRAHWGSPVLAFRWLERMGELRRERPAQPLYWFLIVKGHRTYRYLPAFAKEFHPHWATEPTGLKDLADHLARERFGGDYNPISGVVEYAVSRGHLAAALACPSPREQSLPAVSFFMERNPGFRRGHELVCLCALEASNLKPLGRRIFLRGGQE